jgi:outer membrane protein assembly factor BamC
MGLALDRLGFTIEDRDRAKGLYFIRYIDPEESQKEKGFLSGLFSGGDEPIEQEYQLRLQDAQNTTRVSLLSKQGQRVNDKIAERILLLIQEQLQ